MSGAQVVKTFPFRRKVAAPRLRVLCFPYAGAAASLYRRWIELLPPAVDLCPVEIPGRGVRYTEPPARDMASLCDDLALAIERLGDLPLALFGHSMGARIAFEIARRFPDRVVHLFASGSPAPGAPVRYDVPSGSRPTAQLSDDEFKLRLRELGGTPVEILDNHEWMDRILPIVRADFVLLEQYRVEPDAAVSCPLTVFSGVDDTTASPPLAEAWRTRTTAAFRLVAVDAGHFFLDSHRAQLIREIASDLAPWLGQAPP